MSVEVLSNTVWVNHNSIEIGLPLEVVMEIIKHPKIKDIIANEGLGGYMWAANCPSCGLIATATGTCGYCGSKCE